MGSSLSGVVRLMRLQYRLNRTALFAIGRYIERCDAVYAWRVMHKAVEMTIQCHAASFDSIEGDNGSQIRCGHHFQYA